MQSPFCSAAFLELDFPGAFLLVAFIIFQRLCFVCVDPDNCSTQGCDEAISRLHSSREGLRKPIAKNFPCVLNGFQTLCPDIGYTMPLANLSGQCKRFLYFDEYEPVKFAALPSSFLPPCYFPSLSSSRASSYSSTSSSS